jgi:hypothetical protein
VLRARMARVTWEAIGAALGTSRQGAFNRYGALVQRYERAGLLDAGDVVDPLGGDDKVGRNPGLT